MPETEAQVPRREALAAAMELGRHALDGKQEPIGFAKLDDMGGESTNASFSGQIPIYALTLEANNQAEATGSGFLFTSGGAGFIGLYCVHKIDKSVAKLFLNCLLPNEYSPAKEPSKNGEFTVMQTAGSDNPLVITMEGLAVAAVRLMAGKHNAVLVRYTAKTVKVKVTDETGVNLFEGKKA